MPHINRRIVLQGLGAAGAVGLPLCAQAQGAALRVGFVPVIGAASLFVLDRLGWAKEAGLNLTLSKFDSGPAAIQAFASGSFDVLAIGVAPVAVARAKGFDAHIICAGGLGGSAFIAAPDLAARFGPDGAPAPALAAFRKETGRRAKLATLPRGAIPAVTLQHWLFEIGKVDPADVEIVAIGIEAVQQAILAGAIDGGTVLEPSASLVLARNPRLKMIATALDMFPGIPGLAYSASGKAIAGQRPALVSLIKLLARATDLVRTKPQEAADAVAAALGGGIVDPAIMQSALTSRAISFVADPRGIVEPTRTLLAYQTKIGDFSQAPPIEGLFDLTVWDEAMGR